MTHSITEIEAMMGEIQKLNGPDDVKEYCEKQSQLIYYAPEIISSLLSKLKVAKAALDWYANTYKIFVQSKTGVGILKIKDGSTCFELVDGNNIAKQALEEMVEL